MRAVEHAVTKMASLLQQLASSGALPDQVNAIITLMKNDLQQLALITGIEPEVSYSTLCRMRVSHILSSLMG